MDFPKKLKIILICLCIVLLLATILSMLGILPFFILPICIFITFILSYYILLKQLKWKNKSRK